MLLLRHYLFITPFKMTILFPDKQLKTQKTSHRLHETTKGLVRDPTQSCFKSYYVGMHIYLAKKSNVPIGCDDGSHRYLSLILRKNLGKNITKNGQFSYCI